MACATGAAFAAPLPLPRLAAGALFGFGSATTAGVLTVVVDAGPTTPMLSSSGGSGPGRPLRARDPATPRGAMPRGGDVGAVGHAAAPVVTASASVSGV